MTYKVVPFTANLSAKEGTSAAAAQLQQLCNEAAGQGWEYLGLESVETYIAGTAGCFGLGATPGRTTSFTMAVFKR